MLVSKSYLNQLCPAKVNLILRVGPRRPDSYHAIETLMTQIKWGDSLSLKVREATDETRIQLRSPGLKLAAEKNLVYRAAMGFSKEFGVKFEAEILLKKRVPTGAGLGGGSSDAAKVLELLFDWKFKSRSRYSGEWRRLARLAASLGADIPFFLGGPAAWCTGFGEQISEVKIPKLWLVIVLPKTKVPTPWAYRELDRVRAREDLSERLSGKPDWLDAGTYSIPALENDFEAPVVTAKAKLREIRTAFAISGAEASLMSGSGSSFFGLYRNAKAADSAEKFLKRMGLKAVSTESV